MSNISRSIVYLSVAVLIGSLAACGSNPGSQQATKGTASSPASAPQNVAGQKAMDQASTKEAPPEAEAVPETGGETYKGVADNQFYAAKADPLSTFSIDVDTASYSNLRRFINDGKLPPKDAVRIEEMVNYFPYNYPQPTGDKPFSVNTEVASAPWNTQHKLVQIGLQGKKIGMEQLPPNNLVFLLDVSGSMNEPNKLPLLKASLKLLINELRPQDKVAIVVYAGNAGLVLPSTSAKEKSKIMAALDQLESGGSTAGGQGIIQAYKIARDNFIKDGNNRVVLGTDGDFNVGVSSDEALVKLIEKERGTGVFLSVLGFGMGNLKDGKMEQLANKGNGNYSYIDSLAEAKKVLVKEFGGTLAAIAKDVKIQVEFNPDLVQGYRLIGYENRVLANSDFKNDKKDAGELGAGHTVTALYEVIPVGVKTDFKFAQTNTTDVDKPTKLTADVIGQVNLRYKAPQANESQLLSSTIGQQTKGASENLKFAAAVASYGMILRNSPFKGNSSYNSVLELAGQSKGADLDGYRAEFIRLVENSKKIEKS
jgi:Ca-activated chloride channel homolog